MLKKPAVDVFEFGAKLSRNCFLRIIVAFTHLSIKVQVIELVHSGSEKRKLCFVDLRTD
jgi:hypothetical protein